MARTKHQFNEPEILSPAEINAAVDRIIAALSLDFAALTPRTLEKIYKAIESGYRDGLEEHVIALEVFSVFAEERIFRPGDFKQSIILNALTTI